jgi:hypothetical protein
MIYYPMKKPAPGAQVRKGGSGSRKTELGEASDAELEPSTRANVAAPAAGLVGGGAATNTEDKSTRVDPERPEPGGGCVAESSPVGASLELPGGWWDDRPCMCEGALCGGLVCGRLTYLFHDDGQNVEVFRDDDGVWLITDGADADAILWAILRCTEYGGDR